MALARLKTRDDFRAVLDGPVIARSPHFAMHRKLLLQADAGLVMGAVVPKRWARRAVTRNAIRRQIYDIALSQAPFLKPLGHVVRLRAAYDRKHFVSASSQALKQAVRQELTALFQRASTQP
jgi:ribonuclease P protein component